jgi:lipoyl-dependent peroxiredoxin
MIAIKPLFTARAKATGGRNGHTKSDDGFVDVDLSRPREIGGASKPGGTTPEHLFAAGYAACFNSACELASRQLKLTPSKIEVEAAIGIGPRQPIGYGLKADLVAHIAGLSKEDAEKLVQYADQVCPYSNAVRDNIEVNITVNAL